MTVTNVCMYGYFKPTKHKLADRLQEGLRQFMPLIAATYEYVELQAVMTAMYGSLLNWNHLDSYPTTVLDRSTRLGLPNMCMKVVRLSALHTIRLFPPRG
jgi:hypothetical protein